MSCAPRASIAFGEDLLRRYLSDATPAAADMDEGAFLAWWACELRHRAAGDPAFIALGTIHGLEEAHKEQLRACRGFRNFWDVACCIGTVSYFACVVPLSCSPIVLPP